MKCPIEAVLKAIGGKWKILILWNLVEGTRRSGGGCRASASGC